MAHFTQDDLIALAGIYAQKHGIDPDIFVNQIRQESGFNPNTKSQAGAQGIAQIVPKWHPGVNPMDPVASLNYAAGMMANGIRRYGNVERALSAYNSGNPDAYQNPNFAKGETYNYVRSILNKAGQPSTSGSNVPTAQSEPIPDLPQPNLQPGQMVAPIPGVLLNGSPLPAPTPLSKQANAFNQNLLQQASQPAPPVQLPQPVNEAAIRQQAAHLAQSAAPVGLPQAPQNPDLLHGLGNVLNAGVDYAKGIVHQVGQIPEALGAEAQQFAQDPAAALKAYLATGAGVVQGGRDLLQLPADLSSGVANAYLGHQAFQPLYNLPSIKDIPGVGQPLAQMMQDHPVFSTTGNLVGQSLGAEGLNLLRGQHATPVEAPAPDVTTAQLKPAESTANADALTRAFQERTRPTETPQIQLPGRSSSADLLAPSGEPLNAPRDVNLVKGNALPEGRPEQPLPGDLIPAAKSAQESADVFSHQDQNRQVAQQLLNDASQTRSSAETDLFKAAGVEDPLEAQRTIGQRILEQQKRVEAGDTLSQPEGAQLHEDMTVLDRVLQSREQERLAQQMFDQEHKLTSRSELPESKPESTLPTLNQPSDLLRSSRDMAMERAGSLEGDLLSKPRSNDLLQFKPKEPSDLILPNREPGKVLEFPGKQEPQQILGPSGKPLVSSTPEAGAPSIPAEGVEHTINPQKPVTQEMLDAAQSAKQALMTVADAERHIKQYAPEQMKHFLNTLEAAKNNQTLDVTHAPLNEGGRVVNQREVNPVAFAKQTITARTEVSNLRKQFEGDLSKVRDNLVQRLNEAGVKVNAADQQLKGNRGDITRLNALAEKLPPEKLTHVYVMDHNLGETARAEGSYGFRRMDRIQDSNLTGKAQELPLGTENGNQIAPAFRAFREFANSPEAPTSLKRVSRQIDSGNISRQSLKDLQQAYRDLSPEKLLELCKRFGL